MASVRRRLTRASEFRQAGVATVIKRAAEQGKLEGRNKIQCPELLLFTFDIFDIFDISLIYL